MDTGEPVVLVATRPADRDRTVDCLEGPVDVRHAESVEDAVETLEGAERIDCVVTAASLASGSGVELAETAADRDPAMPVLYVDDDPSVSGAEAATAAGADCYLPRSRAEDGALADRLATAVEDYDRRRQLRYERSVLEAIFQHLPLSLYVKDREGRHVAVSHAVTSGSDNPMLGRTDTEIYDEVEEGMGAAHRDDLQVIETGDPLLEAEERQRNADGSISWYRTSKHPIQADGEVDGLLGVTREVTGTKRREAELERQRWRLEQFATFASTELREPIERALAAVDRADEAEGEGFDEAALDETAASLDRVQTLVETVLELSRSGTREPEPDWLPLAETVDRVWTSLETGAATLSMTVDEDTEVYADEELFGDLLEHLLRNRLEWAGVGRWRDGLEGNEGDREHGDADTARSRAASGSPELVVGTTATGFAVGAEGAGRAAEDQEAGAGLRVAIAGDLAEAHGWDLEEAREADWVRIEGCALRPAGLAAARPEEPLPLTERGDVGGATPPGEASVETDRVTVRGGGRDLWRETTEFYGVWAPVDGAVRIEARISDFEPEDRYSRAGVGLFDPADAAAPLAVAGRQGHDGAELLGRSERGEPVVSRQLRSVEAVDGYYRIDRIGPWATIATSADGEDWRPIAHRKFASGPTAAGLVVCSHAAERRATATFEDVAVRPLSTPDVAVPEWRGEAANDGGG